MANFQNIVGYQLGQGAITTAYSVVYSVPSTNTIPAQPATITFVKDINVCNTTGSAINIYIHFVPNGGSADATNAIYYSYSLAANTTLRWNGTQILNPGGTIQVKASTTGCAIMISGGQAT